MRIFMAVFAALLLMVGQAFAQQPPVSIFSGRVKPLGYCQLTTLNVSTQLTACTGGIPAGASTAAVIVETQAVRYRSDGVAPTATSGMPVAGGTVSVFTMTDLSVLRFIQQSASSTLNIEFFQ